MKKKSLEAKKAQLRRFVLSHWDLEQAKSFAIYLLYHETNQSYFKANEINLDAYRISLIVAYARPFSGNKSCDLPESVLSVLTPNEKKLHDEIVGPDGLRNKIYAHSDPKAHDLKISIKEIGNVKLAFPKKGHPFNGLPYKKLIILLNMINKIQDSISIKIAKLKEHFNAGEKI